MSVSDIRLSGTRELRLEFNSSVSNSLRIDNLSNLISDENLKNHLSKDDRFAINENNIGIHLCIKGLVGVILDITELNTNLNILSLQLDSCNLSTVNYKTNIDTFIMKCNISNITCFTYIYEFIFCESIVQSIVINKGFCYLSLEGRSIIHSIQKSYINDLYIKNDKSCVGKLDSFVVGGIKEYSYIIDYLPSLVINSRFKNLKNISISALSYVSSMVI